MKKILLIISLISILSACSSDVETVSKDEFNSLQNEVAHLNEKLHDIEKDIAILEARISNTTAVSSTAISSTAESEEIPQANFIGNQNSNKFHSPTCPYLPASHNQVPFATRDDAVNSGMIPCKVCNP